MRPWPTSPAVQLKSVSGRYARHDAAHAGIRLAAGSWMRPGGEPPAAAPPADDSLARLEAVLFLAREPLSSRKLAQFAGLEDGTQARTLIRRLNEGYDRSARAFRVEETAGGYQLLTRRGFSGWLRRLAHVPGELRLSAPVLETLAVIAYRQPVLKADIEAIRGVNCGEVLRQLMERDLVRISGRSQELGRPFLYATTRRFLQLFGLRDAADLPRAEELRAAPLPAAPPVFPPLAEGDENGSPSGEEAAAEYTVEDPLAAENELAGLDAGNRP